MNWQNLLSLAGDILWGVGRPLAYVWLLVIGVGLAGLAFNIATHFNKQRMQDVINAPYILGIVAVIAAAAVAVIWLATNLSA